MRGFLEGDRKSIARVEAIVAGVLRFRGYYVPREDRRDLAQEVMLQTYQALSEETPRNFPALVRTIAHRRSVDWMRRHRPTEELSESTTQYADAPDGALIRSEWRRLGRRVLALLPAGCRELILLRLGEELPYAEIAERLGRSVGALRVQMHGCLRKAEGILSGVHRGP